MFYTGTPDFGDSEQATKEDQTNSNHKGRLIVDRSELARFVDLIFRYAELGTIISLRLFDQFDRLKPPIRIVPIAVSDDRESLLDTVERFAQVAADHAAPAVFAPPVCTFRHAADVSSKKAREEDVGNGVSLSVEVDDSDPNVAIARLTSILGLPTVVMSSGRLWTDPKTGELKPKLHAHWRLSEPTVEPADHARLKHARQLAAGLIGGDPSAGPVSHPLRWPGSWNRKAAPVMARIVTANDDAEIHLDEAIEALCEAAEAAGRQDSPFERKTGSGRLEAPLAHIASAMEAIPNEDVHYNEWVRLGYACYHATGGRIDGFDIWSRWSAKSAKHDVGETEATWDRIVAANQGAASPIRCGAGTIFWMASRLYGWQRPQPEPPPDIDDPNYYEDIARDRSDRTGDVENLVRDLNSKFMVVKEGGKAVILNPGYEPALRRRHYDRLTPADFRLLYMNKTIVVGVDKKGNPAAEPIADVWLRHPDRRQYIGGVVFDPSGATDDQQVLNLWTGFAVKSKPGEWGRLRDHVLKVMCGNNVEYYDYLVRWMAYALKNPARQGEVAVVLKGKEGTGKGTLAKIIMHLFGQHAMAISNARHLVGNFNAHLRDAIFLFADEAFFAGDKQHIGVLKSLITEPHLAIEAKYHDPISTPNYLHIMMASNEEWVVPASIEARRFFVLLVGDEHMGDHDYFGAIWNEMENGGYEALLYDLLAMDLTAFNVRDVPKTEGLQQQKKLSLPATEAWWVDCLHRGYVFRSKLGLEDHFMQWHSELTTELLFDSYVDYARRVNNRRPLSREDLGKWLKQLGCVQSRPRNAVVGEHIAEVAESFGSTKRKAETVVSPRASGYRLGSLSEAREAFCTVNKLTIDWGEDDEGP